MKKFEITVLQNMTTGELTITCNDPNSYLKQHKIVQVYLVADTSKDGRPSTNARQSIKTRTNGYLKQYDSSTPSCHEIENMVMSTVRFSVDGCLTITKKFGQPLHKLIITSLERLKAVQSKLIKEKLINNESYCIYLYFNPLKVTMSFSATKSERDDSSLMHTYVCDTLDNKRALLSTIKTLTGTLKSLPITQGYLLSIQEYLIDYTNKSDKTTLFDLFNFIRDISKPIE